MVDGHPPQAARQGVSISVCFTMSHAPLAFVKYPPP
jgi:hypothetical protein